MGFAHPAAAGCIEECSSSTRHPFLYLAAYSQASGPAGNPTCMRIYGGPLSCSRVFVIHTTPFLCFGCLQSGQRASRQPHMHAHIQGSLILQQSLCHPYDTLFLCWLLTFRPSGPPGNPTCMRIYGVRLSCSRVFVIYTTPFLIFWLLTVRPAGQQATPYYACIYAGFAHPAAAGCNTVTEGSSSRHLFFTRIYWLFTVGPAGSPICMRIHGVRLQ
jgi:hypothetical protein